MELTLIIIGSVLLYWALGWIGVILVNKVSLHLDNYNTGMIRGGDEIAFFILFVGVFNIVWAVAWAVGLTVSKYAKAMSGGGDAWKQYFGVRVNR